MAASSQLITSFFKASGTCSAAQKQLQAPSSGPGCREEERVKPKLAGPDGTGLVVDQTEERSKFDGASAVLHCDEDGERGGEGGGGGRGGEGGGEGGGGEGGGGGGGGEGGGGGGGGEGENSRDSGSWWSEDGNSRSSTVGMPLVINPGFFGDGVLHKALTKIGVGDQSPNPGHQQTRLQPQPKTAPITTAQATNPKQPSTSSCVGDIEGTDEVSLVSVVAMEGGKEKEEEEEGEGEREGGEKREEGEGEGDVSSVVVSDDKEVRNGTSDQWASTGAVARDCPSFVSKVEPTVENADQQHKPEGKTDLPSSNGGTDASISIVSSPEAVGESSFADDSKDPAVCSRAVSTLSRTTSGNAASVMGSQDGCGGGEVASEMEEWQSSVVRRGRGRGRGRGRRRKNVIASSDSDGSACSPAKQSKQAPSLVECHPPPSINLTSEPDTNQPLASGDNSEVKQKGADIAAACTSNDQCTATISTEDGEITSLMDADVREDIQQGTSTGGSLCSEWASIFGKLKSRGGGKTSKCNNTTRENGREEKGRDLQEDDGLCGSNTCVSSPSRVVRLGSPRRRRRTPSPLASRSRSPSSMHRVSGRTSPLARSPARKSPRASPLKQSLSSFKRNISFSSATTGKGCFHDSAPFDGLVHVQQRGNPSDPFWDLKEPSSFKDGLAAFLSDSSAQHRSPVTSSSSLTSLDREHQRSCQLNRQPATTGLGLLGPGVSVHDLLLRLSRDAEGSKSARHTREPPLPKVSLIVK